MADADIVIVGQGELSLVADLYNQVFRPGKDEEFFKRRLAGRYQSLILIANVEQRPVGFSISMELKPDTWFGWLTGVLPDYRRAKIATQLLKAELEWAREHHYALSRYECFNRHKPMLHLALTLGYDIVGIRWDPGHHDNIIIFEKDLATESAE